MSEPWNERVSDDRPEPSIYTFVIFCEDSVSEPKYFESFRKDNLLAVRTFKGITNKKLNVDKAIAHCVNTGLLKPQGEDLVPTPMFEDGFQVWCVFDRDKKRGGETDNEDNITFHTSIKNAEKHSIKVAWSNDAFELWVLLHIQEVNPQDHDYLHRDKYYELLENYFKAVSKPGDELKRKLTFDRFSYDDLKNAKVFIADVLPVLKSNINIAIERAKKLEEFHKNKVAYEKAPCTMVHKLVLELIDKGDPPATL